MKNNWWVLLLVIFGACQTEKEVTLPTLANAEMDLKNIVSVAQCTYSGGNYTTEVHSTAEGGVYFRQVFTDMDRPFEVVALDSSRAYTLDSNHVYKDTLGVQAIEMLRGHEFHWMALEPSRYFSDLKMVDTETDSLGRELTIFEGHDRFYRYVKLVISNETNLVDYISFQNPLKVTELIEVKYLTYMDSDIGQIVKTLNVTQNERDLFVFNFIKVELNSANVKYVQ